MKSFSHVNSKGQPIDVILDSIFNKQGGFYIELGANDGLKQSNSAFFEFYKGWKGVLIEPSHVAYLECCKNRPQSKCYNLACVSNTYTDAKIIGDFNGNLMSSVNGTRKNSANVVSVEVSTLEKILDIEQPTIIDFLSLDTEGYELEILKGLNLNKYRPRYMLIEVYNKDYDDIVTFLKINNYTLHMNISNYNSIDNPHWDGTHNDYLFIDTTVL